ncbi:hypothetical protein BJ508DRAFT_346195 [Ascobolus immersus RN42]|uniref:F-box domain-containing protein n=1 Tax=Ascobolus immersus RN42 TaxID=1160509 RepID=A0A3N4HMN3_ASCIM|nr:hypothetical protein BJ508DRAFT_346195 [Ascobolus immersus RN42]
MSCTHNPRITPAVENANLARLPAELLHAITPLLSPIDFIALSRTNRRLNTFTTATRSSYLKQWIHDFESHHMGSRTDSLISFIPRFLRLKINMNQARPNDTRASLRTWIRRLRKPCARRSEHWIWRYVRHLGNQARERKHELRALYGPEKSEGRWYSSDVALDWEGAVLAAVLEENCVEWRGCASWSLPDQSCMCHYQWKGYCPETYWTQEKWWEYDFRTREGFDHGNAWS